MFVSAVRAGLFVLCLLPSGGCVTRDMRISPVDGARRNRALALQANERGLDLVARGELPAAQQAFLEALRADPYCGPAHCNLGVVFLRQGRYYDAGWELQYACQLMPRASQPRTNLGLLYESVGRYGPAEENLRAGLELAPEDIEIVGHLARILLRQGKRSGETIAWLDTIATRDPDVAWREWAARELLKSED